MSRSNSITPASSATSLVKRRWQGLRTFELTRQITRLVEVPAPQKTLLICLADHAADGSDGYASSPTRRQLARESGQSRNSVQRNLARLEGAGHITKDSGKASGQASVYRLEVETFTTLREAPKSRRSAGDEPRSERRRRSLSGLRMKERVTALWVGFTTYQLTRMIIRLVRLPATHKALLLCLADHASDGTDNYASNPSQSLLAREAGLSRDAVHRTLAKLKAAGYINVEGGKYKGFVSVYRLNADKLTGLREVATNRGGCTTESHGGCTTESHKEETVTTYPLKEKITAAASRRSLNEHRKAEYAGDLDKFRAARIKRELATADTPPPPDDEPPPAQTATPKRDRTLDWIKQRRQAEGYSDGELIRTYRFINDSYIGILSKKFNRSGKPYDTSGLQKYLMSELQPELKKRPATMRWLCSQ